MKKTFYALLIVLGYIISRSFIYALMPITSDTDWFWRDVVMDLPRFIWALVALYLGYRTWGWQKLGFSLERPILAMGVGIALLLVEAVFSLMGQRPFVLPNYALFIFYVSSFMVGFFEEILFRGVLLNALRDWKGSLIALWGSTFVFTVYHIQAQPYHAWPGIFTVGFVLALLRLNNVSMLWLILFHGVNDCVLGIVGRMIDVEMKPFYNLALIMIAVCAAIYLRINRSMPVKSSSRFSRC